MVTRKYTQSDYIRATKARYKMCEDYVPITSNISMEKMPERKLEAFFQQFPFVGTKIGRKSIRQVFVDGISFKAIDRSLEKVVDFGCADPFDFSGARYDEVAYLLDKDGKMVKWVEEYTVMEKAVASFSPKTWFLPRVPVKRTRTHEGIARSEDGGSVEGVLHALKEKGRDVVMMLSFHEFTGVAILYKVPDEMSLPEWLDRHKSDEMKKYSAEWKKVDKAAVKS